MVIRNNGWSTITTREKLAIVGMDIISGAGDGLDAFQFSLYEGSQQIRLPQSPKPRAVELDQFFSDIFSKSRIKLSKEEYLLLKTAGRAMRDAGLKEPYSRSAFLFGLGSRLAALVGQQRMAGENTPGLSNSQDENSISRLRKFFNPLIDISRAGNPLASSLAEACSLLSDGIVDSVVIGSASLIEDFSGFFQPTNSPIKTDSLPYTFGFDQTMDGWTTGEGAAALVVMQYKTAVAEQKRIYAVLDAMSWVTKAVQTPIKNVIPTLVSSETISLSCNQAVEAAGLNPEKIDYLETLGSGFTPLDTAEITGLARFFKSVGTNLTCAIGSVQTNCGYLFNSAGIAALIKTALCLYHRMIPRTPHWNGPKKPELWTGTSFYIPGETITWFLPANDSERVAAVNAIGVDGSCAHLILSEGNSQKYHPNRFLMQSRFYMFPISGDSPAELLESLKKLEQKLQNSENLFSNSQQNYNTFLEKPEAKYSLAIVGNDTNEILKETEYALKGIPSAIEKKIAWQTPMGSYFTPQPVGKFGGVAFVYPGAFNSYLGLGRDLLLLFPQLHEPAFNLISDPEATTQYLKLYPRSLETLSKEQFETLESQLIADPISMLTSGSWMAVLFTMILRDIFKIKPAAALGYSLGEISMLFGMGVWKEGDATVERLNASPLFNTRLSGPQNAIREFWGLPPIYERLPGKTLWSNYFLMSPPEKVIEAIKDIDRVYMTHINTPRQVVVAGDEKGCRQLITTLKSSSLKAPFDFALHCEAICSEYDELVDLHTWPVAVNSEIPLYSAADNLPLPMDSHGIATKIGTMLSSSLDFPGLVNKVYNDGARVFIELGANANCSKWIDETLKGKSYIAIPINRKGVDDQTSIVRMLAKLVSHRVDVDCSMLYQ